MTSAARVDCMVASSAFGAQGIEFDYWREAAVLNSLLAIDDFPPSDTEAIGDHNLSAGELVSYKRVDLAVRAFTRPRRRFRAICVGDPPAALQRVAWPNGEFCGSLSLDWLRHRFATCRALVLPEVEDFGSIPGEVMAAGRPVSAVGRGRGLDRVMPGNTGIVTEQSAPALAKAVDRFEAQMLPHLDVAVIRKHADGFSSAAVARK